MPRYRMRKGTQEDDPLVSAVTSIEIIDRDGKSHGPFNGRAVDDMRLSLDNSEALDAIALGRGCFVQVPGEPVTRRSVVGSNILGTGDPFLDALLGERIEIFAPGRIAADVRSYASWAGVMLRPGTTILGGSLTGFPDNYGVILEAIPTRSLRGREVEWVYRSAGPLVGVRAGNATASWHTWDDIGPEVHGPEAVLEFPSLPNRKIDALLDAGEKEILEHFAKHPELLDEIHPAKFEDLVEAIYKGLGFTTERIGAWNQADGGVDMLAVSKTAASTNVTLAIQCKAGRGNVGPSVVRELAAVLDPSKAHVGVVATSSRFTSSAQAEAEGRFWRVRLQDGDDIYRRILGVLRSELRDLV